MKPKWEIMIKKIYRLLNCKHTVKGFVFRYMDSIKDIV